MRDIIKLILIIIVVAAIVLQTLSYLLIKKAVTQYTDSELREAALSRNMLSIPSTYEELLKVVDTKENKLSKDKIELGKDLFFDKILSKNRDISCDTCHVIDKDIKNNRSNKQFSKMLLSENKNAQKDCTVCHLFDQSGTDRLATSIGHDNKQHPFHLNTLSILNSSLAKYQTWDASVSSVEEQAGISIQDLYKMNLTKEEAIKRLSLDKAYVNKFEKVFKDEQNLQAQLITFENIQKAIGAYVRILLTRSDYDKFLDGDNSAMSEQAKKGLANFMNFGCKGCHTGMSVGGQNIQKFPVRDYNSILDLTNTFIEDEKGREVNGVSLNFDMRHSYPFENIGGFLGMNNQQLFRVPILRNVTKTSPYFHNGTVDTLRDAIRYMAKHQLGMNPTNKQVDEIVAFFESLEGDIVDYQIQERDK